MSPAPRWFGLFTKLRTIEETTREQQHVHTNQVEHETDVEKWFIDRDRSEKNVPQATVVGTFT